MILQVLVAWLPANPEVRCVYYLIIHMTYLLDCRCTTKLFYHFYHALSTTSQM